MIVDLNLALARYVAWHMRDDDFREVTATRRDDYRHTFAADCTQIGGRACVADDGTPVAMGGIHEVWPHVGTAWMVATPEIDRRGVELTRFCKRLLAEYGHLHRVQAFSAAFHTVSHKWLEVLGFVRAAELKHFGKRGEDFILFERIS